MLMAGLSGIDYVNALKAYGWDNLIRTIQDDPAWQQANNSDRGAENVAVNVPGIGPVTIDSNGRVNALDIESALAYQRTGNAPVFNTIWDGRDRETGAYNGSDPVTYQVSHGGISADTLGLIAAAVVTAGAVTGWGAGLGVTEAGAGVGTFAAPTAEELAAFGADAGGMGITGAGGIGSASSLVDAGIGGSLGYGSTAVAATAATGGYANEWTKLMQQQALADSGVDILSTSLPTIDLGASSWSLSSLSDIRKALSAVKAVTGAVATGTAVTRTPSTVRSVLPPSSIYSQALPMESVQLRAGSVVPWLLAGLATLFVIGSGT